MRAGLGPGISSSSTAVARIVRSSAKACAVAVGLPSATCLACQVLTSARVISDIGRSPKAGLIRLAKIRLYSIRVRSASWRSASHVVAYSPNTIGRAFAFASGESHVPWLIPVRTLAR